MVTKRSPHEKHFPVVFRDAPFGYLRATVEGKLIEANAVAASILGFESLDALIRQADKKTITDLLIQDSSTHERTTTDRWAKNRANIRRPNGSFATIDIVYRVLRKKDEAKKEVQYFLEDITEGKWAEEDLGTNEHRFSDAFERAAI